MKKIVFTDLDGTLLEAENYSFESAKPALERLCHFEIPLVLVTSKTRAEVEIWRDRLKNTHPFIAENGGAIFVPSHYFLSPPPCITRSGAYEVVQLGDSYESLLAALQMASEQSGCRIRGFHDMTAEEVSSCCQLPLDQAILAKQREFDEPFEILEPEGEQRLLQRIEALGKRWTRGGRFFHIMGANDKARAVLALCELYRKAHSRIMTIGLGDGLNDLSFLSIMNIPVIVKSRHLSQMKSRLPHAFTTAEAGPKGWSQAILELIP